MKNESRLGREKMTIRHMIGIFCRGHHESRHGLCGQCRQLLDYAMQRIDNCPFHGGKPTCAKCPVHCFKPAMREDIRRVMRYAGPRMLFFHPLLAVLHFADELKRPRGPAKRGK